MIGTFFIGQQKYMVDLTQYGALDKDPYFCGYINKIPDTFSGYVVVDCGRFEVKMRLNLGGWMNSAADVVIKELVDLADLVEECCK